MVKNVVQLTKLGTRQANDGYTSSSSDNPVMAAIKQFLSIVSAIKEKIVVQTVVSETEAELVFIKIKKT